MTHTERDIQLSESEVANVKAAKASFKKYEVCNLSCKILKKNKWVKRAFKKSGKAY